MKHKRMMALALVSVLTVSALAPGAFAATSGEDSGTSAAIQETVRSGRRGKHGKQSSVSAPENAIGKDAAKEKALADAGVTAEQAGKVRSHLSRTDDGTVVYKVRFSCDGQRYSYQIDAVTGAILDKHAEAAAEQAEQRHSRGKRPDKVDETAAVTA